MNFFAHKNKSQGDVLKPGQYKATLEKVYDGVGRSYEKESPRPTLTFSFLTSCGAVVNRTVTASASEKGMLLPLIRALAGSNQPSRQTIDDGEKLTQFIQDLVEKEYLIQVRPSDNGRFNNLVSAVPISSQLLDRRD
jgi:hypothetical protein